jgi:hypothetical protein
METMPTATQVVVVSIGIFKGILIYCCNKKESAFLPEYFFEHELQAA